MHADIHYKTKKWRKSRLLGIISTLKDKASHDGARPRMLATIGYKTPSIVIILVANARGYRRARKRLFIILRQLQLQLQLSAHKSQL